MTVAAQYLPKSFAVLKPDQSVETVAVGPALYQELDRDFSGFKSHALVSVHEFSADWPSWERHPAGDEIVILLSGNASLILRCGEGEQRIELADSLEFVVVPRNTWHTAKIPDWAQMLFITPGEGTENQVIDCSSAPSFER